MNASWITIPVKPDRTALYIFKKTFDYVGEANSFKIDISADSRYRLYINGRELAAGPCQSGEGTTHYESLDAVRALVQGENKIEVRVFHLVGDHWLNMWRREKPALFFNGVINDKVEILSDTSFTCERVRSLAFYNCDEIMDSVAPFEHMNGDWVTEPLDTVIMYAPNYELNFYTHWGTTEPYMLEPRPIPILLPEEKKPIEVIREYTDADGKYNIILDAGAYTTAVVSLELLAKSGTHLRICYAECMMKQGENGEIIKGQRDDGDVITIGYDTITASGKLQSFETFWYRAFRFIKIECEEKPEMLQAYQARSVYCFEKFARHGGVGGFKSDDQVYSDMWRVGVNTLECSSHETFVDCPYYEQRQYTMDGGLEALFAWRLSNDSGLQKQLIASMVASQEPSGMIHASYPYYAHQIIPTFSLYYVLHLREYLRYTGDVSFVKKYIGVCERVLEAFEGMRNEQGLVLSKQGWCFLDWVNTWTIGVPNGGQKWPITVYSMMYAAALESQAQVCQACGRVGLAQEYRERRNAVIGSINEHCYDPEKGMYIDVVGMREFSRHTTVWAILSGCVEGEEAQALMKRTMEYTYVSPCSFAMNYYVLRALEKAGLYDQYAEGILDGWRTMLKLGCTTWCESLALPRSECHGWSSTPIYEMSAMILGVQPTGDGFERVRIQPHPLGLSHASGRVPTPWGYIDVEWKRE